jgi:hypothetical protein
LVELLVIIGIVAVLISLLTPVLSKARLMAKRAVCTTNLRNMSQAFGVYAQDFSGRFPRFGFGHDHSTCAHSLFVWQKDVAELYLHQYMGGRLEGLYCPVSAVDELLEEWWFAEWQQTYGLYNCRRLVHYSVMTLDCLNPGVFPEFHHRDGRNWQIVGISDDGERTLATDLIRWAGPWDRWELADDVLDDDGDPEGLNHLFINGAVRWVAYDDVNYNYGFPDYRGPDWKFYWVDE